MNNDLEQSRVHFFQGIEHFESGRHEVATEPDKADVLLNLGLAHEARAEWEPASSRRQRGDSVEQTHNIDKQCKGRGIHAQAAKTVGIVSPESRR